MTTQAEIKETIRNFIFQKFPAAARRHVGDDDSLLAGGIVDSLGVLDVVQFMEETFGITLSDEDMLSDHFETISGMAGFVAGRRLPSDTPPSPPPLQSDSEYHEGTPSWTT